MTDNGLNRRIIKAAPAFLGAVTFIVIGGLGSAFGAPPEFILLNVAAAWVWAALVYED